MDNFAEAMRAMETPLTSKPAPEKQRFPCQACGGTGLWRERRANKHGSTHCFACGGKGYFLTSPEQRAKAKRQRAEAKERRVEARRNAAREKNSEHGIRADLVVASSWNGFAQSLINQDAEGRAWSDAQVAAAQRMLAKIAAKREAQQDAPEVDLSGIERMFEVASANYKRPAYRALGLRIKPGRGGSLYVLNEDREEEGYYGTQPGYEGKVLDAKFLAGRDCASDTLDKLQQIAADPKAEAIRWGQKTGRCSCCGRELTKHASIDAGIGPICAEKWGFG